MEDKLTCPRADERPSPPQNDDLNLARSDAGATALITSALFSLSRSARAMQNTVTYPLYVLSGVLVPASYLPNWLEPVSKVLFLSWAADLLRDSLSAEPVDDFVPRLLVVAALGAGALALGTLLLNRMIDRLRADGRLGL